MELLTLPGLFVWVRVYVFELVAVLWVERLLLRTALLLRVALTDSGLAYRVAGRAAVAVPAVLTVPLVVDPTPLTLR